MFLKTEAIPIWGDCVQKLANGTEGPVPIL